VHLSSETDEQIWRYQDPKTPSDITYESPKNFGSKKCSSVTSKEISNVSRKFKVDKDEIFTVSPIPQIDSPSPPSPAQIQT
jgi:hypothetical protein